MFETQGGHAESNPRPSEEGVSFYHVLRPLDHVVAGLVLLVVFVVLGTAGPLLLSPCNTSGTVWCSPGGVDVCAGLLCWFVLCDSTRLG